MPRLTTRITGYQTRSQFDEALNKLAVLITRIRLAEAKRDKKIQAIRDETDPEITEAISERDNIMRLAEDYVFDHQADVLDKGTKSGRTALATFGLRVGNPTLKTINRNWTWAKVLDAVKRLYKGRFIRSKEELDKDGLKIAFSKEPEKLAEVGCTIEQTEAFWVEPIDKAVEATR